PYTTLFRSAAAPAVTAGKVTSSTTAATPGTARRAAAAEPGRRTFSGSHTRSSARASVWSPTTTTGAPASRYGGTAARAPVAASAAQADTTAAATAIATNAEAKAFLR